MLVPVAMILTMWFPTSLQLGVPEISPGWHPGNPNALLTPLVSSTM
jgi:hypothetical protein